MDFETTHKVLAAFERERVSVVTPQMLYEMKKATVRPQDSGDAARLRQFFELGDRDAGS